MSKCVKVAGCFFFLKYAQHFSSSANEMVDVNLPVVAVEGERSLWCGRRAGLEIVDAASMDYNVAKRPCGIGKRKYSKMFKHQCFHNNHSQT